MKTQLIAYDLCRCFVLDAMGDVPEEVSKRILGWCRARELALLVNAITLFDPDYHGVGVYRFLSQVSAFFKKNPDFASDDVCETAAKNSFFKAEQRCRVTNRRLDWYFTKRDRLDPDLSTYMDRMEAFITRVLGPFDAFLDELPRNVRVTPGATATSPRRLSLPFMKMKKQVECTRGAEPYLQALSRWFGYGKLKARHLSWNRVEFVPKNWKTHRTIACEPTGNIPLQLAFDTYAKERLRKKAGIDLRFQSKNQDMALEASISGKYATIDLAAASDTLSYNTVAWLLPAEWFAYLSAIRSPLYRIGDSLTPYTKFSSMGNGATFALETLVFSAACSAVGSDDFSVYGDDIIIETEYVEKLVQLLSFIGFGVNHEKSFSTGPFRESCGLDAYSGEVITPFYVRCNWKLLPEVSHCVNGLAAVALPEGHLWEALAKIVIDRKLNLTPFSDGSLDGVWVDVPTSYRLHLIRLRKHGRGQGVLYVKRYSSQAAISSVQDLRTLTLWYLSRYRSSDLITEQRAFPWMIPLRLCSVSAFGKDATISSSVPSLCHKYRRKWVSWHLPTQATPAHLYWWSEYLVDRLAGS